MEELEPVAGGARADYLSPEAAALLNLPAQPALSEARGPFDIGNDKVSRTKGKATRKGQSGMTWSDSAFMLSTCFVLWTLSFELPSRESLDFV